MTVNQLFRELQKLKLDGCGEYEVLMTDFTNDPPVPEPLKRVKVREIQKRVFLESITVQDLVEDLSKR